MINIIHGDDIESSRKFLVELKSAAKNSVTLDGKELTFDGLFQTLKSNSLFSEDKNIFIENLFSKKKGSELDEIIELLKKNPRPKDDQPLADNLNIVLWEDKELSKSQLSIFQKAKINLFKIPKNLFSFLDNLAPNSTRNILNFHEALKNSDVEGIFYMLIRQFRLLLSLRDSSSIDETKRLAPWQKDKLQRQSKMFTIEQLKRIYNKLYETDLNIKTGVYSNLTNAIDFLLLDIK